MLSAIPKILVALMLLAMSACYKPGGVEVQNLDQGWTVFSDTLDTLHQVNLPNSVFQLLHDQKMIPHYHDFEAEKSLAPLSEKTWIWETGFIPDKALLEHNNQLILLEGINTYAQVFLNDRLIYVADNMFQSHEVVANKALQEGQNQLKIVFPPQASYIDSLQAKAGASLPDNRAFLRKAAYQSGWDWAPKIISPEISQTVKLLGWSKLKVNSLSILQPHVDVERASLSLSAEIEADQKRTYKIILLHQGRKLVEEKVHLNSGINQLEIPFTISNPDLWWPIGYGNQPMYNFDIQIFDGNHIIYNKEKKIGLRSIKLVQNPDSIGQSFTFEVNGLRIYARGANYVPEDLLTANIKTPATKKILLAAAENGMNMLRVWGGGIYPSDEFYNICDSLGILVWQDFMFANTLYPTDSAFLSNVKKEAEQQIKRLRDKTSLAIWCGNNEIDEGFHNWGWEKQLGWTPGQKDSLWNGYQALFGQMLPDLVHQYDPYTFYWPSSPATGWGRPESLLHGDVHYWGVWWGEEPFEKYQQKVSRFNSEFGFQALPDAHTLRQVTPQNEWFPGSAGLEYYQKHPRGTVLIDRYMQADFPVPEMLEDYIYMSQLTQAYGIGIAIEAQRLSNGHSSGTLIWQLNDAWPGISWSVIDFYGRPKALFYHLKRLYKPVLIGMNPSNKTPEALIANQGLLPINARMYADLLDFKGNVLHALSVPVQLEPGQQQAYSNIIPAEILQKIDRRKVWLKIRLSASGKHLAVHNYFFVSPKMVKLPKSEVYMRLMPRKDFVEIILQSDNYVRYLQLSSNDPDGNWENNYFDLEPAKPATIRFYPSGKIPLNELKFEKRSLNDFVN
jgi:beta-mannosidase